MAFGICADIVALAVILFFVDRDEASEVYKIGIVCVAIGIVNAIIRALLGDAMGDLVLAAMLVADGLIIMFAFSMVARMAAIVIAAFFPYKIAFAVVMGLLFSTPAGS